MLAAFLGSHRATYAWLLTTPSLKAKTGPPVSQNTPPPSLLTNCKPNHKHLKRTRLYMPRSRVCCYPLSTNCTSALPGIAHRWRKRLPWRLATLSPPPSPQGKHSRRRTFPNTFVLQMMYISMHSSLPSSLLPFGLLSITTSLSPLSYPILGTGDLCLHSHQSLPSVAPETSKKPQSTARKPRRPRKDTSTTHAQTTTTIHPIWLTPPVLHNA